MRLRMWGEHNLRNALASIAASAFVGVDPASISAGLEKFVGVRRRQELLGTVGDVTLIDDFAHHPTAVEQTLAGLRTAYPEGRLWAVFEPASSTNSRDTFEADYVSAFTHADAVVVGAVPRPERSRGDTPFSAERLILQIRAHGIEAWNFTDTQKIIDHLLANTRAGDLVVFMSNGGFGGVQAKTLAALKDQVRG